MGTVTLWSHFYYYLFTYGNNVGSISSTINLQTWLLNCELHNARAEKQKGRRLINTTAEDIYNLCRLHATLVDETYGTM